MHEWVLSVYKDKYNEFKCVVCGFLWKHNMKKPTVTCEEVLASNRRPNKMTATSEGWVLK